MEIISSSQAERDLDELVGYLDENWPQRIKTDFLAILSDKMRLIESMPELYRMSQKRPGLRECVLNKHTIMYYKISPEKGVIEIVAFLSAGRNDR